MAHDKQVAENSNEAGPNSGLTMRKKRAGESLDVLADWWALYGQIYRDDPTHALAVAYREMLKDVKPSLLHKAFMEAAKKSPKFRPTPGNILEEAELIALKEFKPTAVKYPEVSQEERDAALAETEPSRLALRQKLGLKHDPKCLCADCRERRNGQD